MNYIWSAEKLTSLVGHQDPEVREWAMDKLAALYPQAAPDAAVTLLDDKNRSVSGIAMDYLLDHPSESHKDILLRSYKKGSGAIAGKTVGVLAKLGDTRVADAFHDKYGSLRKIEADLIGYSTSLLHLSALDAHEARDIIKNALTAFADAGNAQAAVAPGIFQANLSAGTDMKVMFDLCWRHQDSRSLLVTLLAVNERSCGSWYEQEDIEEQGDAEQPLPEMVMESLDFIGERGYPGIRKDVERIYKKEKYAETVEALFLETTSALDKVRGVIGFPAYDRWLAKRGEPGRNIAAIIAFHAALGTAPTWARELIARCAISVFARFAEYRVMVGLNLEEMATDDLLRAFLFERGDVKQDAELIAVLAKAEERADLVAACVAHVRQHPGTWAAPRIVRLLGELRDGAALEQLMELPTGHDMVWEDMSPALSRLGPGAVEVLQRLIEKHDDDRISYALEALEDVPTQEAADLVITHWDRLIQRDKEMALEAARGLGHERFIDLIGKDLRDGEYLEAEIFAFLCSLHGVKDKRLKIAERAIREREARAAKSINAIKASDVKRLLREPVRIELRCRSCGRSYHYEVEHVFVEVETQDIAVQDIIKCKNCGVVDDCEITRNGHLSVTSSLTMLFQMTEKSGEGMADGVFHFGQTAPIDGKRMTLREAVEHYEEKLRKAPDDAGLRIGYANILRNTKRTREAIEQYYKALTTDPLAIEAYLALGEIAAAAEDFETAYEHFRKAGDIVHVGRFYRYNEDTDRAREAVLNNLAHFERMLGKRPATEQAGPSLIKQGKAGRNDPCPCGSGKKYKKCCLLKQGEHKSSATSAISDVENALMERLFTYSYDKKFRGSFLQASGRYWRTEPKEPLVLPEDVVEEDHGAFTEWFLNDFLLPSGKTIVEEFYSAQFSRLTPEERAILEAHMVGYTSVYEIQEVFEGKGFRAKDLLMSGELEIREVSGSRQLVKWDIITARVYTVNGISKIAGPTTQMVPRDLLDSFMGFLRQEQEVFTREAGKEGWPAFMKARSYRIRHFFADLPEQKRVFHTDEGHQVVIARAEHRTGALRDVITRFEKEYDFMIDEVKSGKEAKLSWIKRGPSKEWPAAAKLPEKGLLIQSKMLHESGKLEWPVLGTISITSDRLTLECFSRERLERGNKRLKEILGGLIEHTEDSFQNVDEAMKKRERSGPEKEPKVSRHANLLAQAQLTRQYQDWTDSKLPALNGMSPREAVRTTEGRQRVLDILKDIENAEERSRKEGRLYLDVAVLRKELGLE